MMKMICPSCGQAYDEGTVFCTACGSKLTAAEPPDPIEAPRQEQAQQPEAFSKGAPTAPRPVISYTPDTAAPATDDTPDIYTAPSGQPFSIPQSTPADVPAPPVQPPPDNAPHDYDAASIWADRTAAAEPAPQASGAQQPPPRPGVAPPAAYAPPYAPSLPPTAQTTAQPPQKGGPYELMSTGGFIGSMLLMMVPVVGWIFAIVWACGGCKKRVKRNFALASVILALIGLFLSLLTLLTLRLAVPDLFERVSAGFNAALQLDVRTGQASGAHFPGGNDEASGQQDASSGNQAVPDTPGAFSGFDSAPYFNLLTSGQYYLKGKAEVMGISMAFEQAVQGDRMAVIGNLFGIDVYQLVQGNDSYLLDPDNSIYCPGTAEEITALQASDFDRLQYVRTGSERFNGLDCTYDEFKYDGGSNDGSTCRVYMQDGRLVGLSVIDAAELMNLTMAVDTLTDQIPDGMLEIPAGYTEVTEDEFNEKMLSGWFS